MCFLYDSVILSVAISMALKSLVYTRREKESMDHGMGENNGGNGILMEDEIFDTPPASPQPQVASSSQGTALQYAAPSQPQVASPFVAPSQPEAASPFVTPAQSEAASPYVTPVQPEAASPFVTPTQPQPTQSQPVQQMAQPQQSDELAAFKNAPSFDAMDGMDMGISSTGSNGAFGESTTSSDWQNQDSNMAFQGSSAGENVVMYEETTSNVVLGLVGALIGALIGAVLWIVIYQLGYLAGIAGAAIIGFSIKGYVILGRSIDMKGLILCAVLSLATIYFSHRVAFSITYMRTMNEIFGTDMNFITTFINLDKLMETIDSLNQAVGGEDSVTVAFWRDLFVGYVLSAVVGIPMAKNMITRS